MKKTVKLKLVIGVLVLGLTIFCMKGVYAEEDYHWKFMVPVELKNMHPDAKTLKVVVSVRNDAGEQLGDTPVPVINIPANGNYNGVIEIKIKANPGKDPFSATNYDVVMFINDVQPSPNSPHIWAKPKPGTEFVPLISKAPLPK